MAGSRERLPRWSLAAVYPGLGSPAHAAAKARLAELAERFLSHLGALPAGASAEGGEPAEGAEAGSQAFGAWLALALELENAATSLAETLSSYAYASYSTATRDPRALAELNAAEELSLPLKRAEVLFKNALAARAPEVRALAAADPRVAPYAFHLEELLFWQSRQMSPELEELAEDLSRSGGEAWGRLQESLSSNAGALWEARTGERRTLVELRNLAYDPDRGLRERAYRLELELLRGAEIPLAAALNGVKGTALALDRRRGWAEPLDKALAQSRITRASLDALLGAAEDSLPAWRRYLRAKAGLFGAESLAFFDLFAPLEGAGTGRPWSFAEAADLIVEAFSRFDPEMGAYARDAFALGWIDAEPRPGKVGGAYCIDFPEAGAARVLCNFDGSFSALCTVAHELGHAWHHECVKGLPQVLTQYPLTLAETASIFAEHLVLEAALEAAPPSQRLGLLEGRLQDGCQVIVDILSRFRFERALFERRGSGELGPEALCELMAEAQRGTYGEGLDPGLLHPYMWAVKAHYYDLELPYYNFPYAFGLLLGLGLYERYREEGPGFAAAYRGFLARTGSRSAAELCREAGFDIESPDFWRRGLGVLAGQIEQFEALLAPGGPRS